jgi:hypothetical protein
MDENTDWKTMNIDSSHDGMKQGWTGTFEQLADYLVKTYALVVGTSFLAVARPMWRQAKERLIRNQ